MTQIKGRELKLIMAGRNVGKSYWTNQAINRLVKDLTSQPVEDLKTSEGTVYGSRYYCVEPVGGNWREMQEWAVQTYGESGKHIWGEKETPEPRQRWYMNNRKFWFRDEQDRTMFILKWRAR